MASCACTECNNHSGRYFDGSHSCTRDAKCGCSPKKCVGCDHPQAVYQCQSCIHRVRTRWPMFPLQPSRNDSKTLAGPDCIEWSLAEKAGNEYRKRYGTNQSLERMAERGGFGWEEMDLYYPPWREEIDDVLKLRERVKVAEVDAGNANRMMERLAADLQESQLALRAVTGELKQANAAIYALAGDNSRAKSKLFREFLEDCLIKAFEHGFIECPKCGQGVPVNDMDVIEQAKDFIKEHL